MARLRMVLRSFTLYAFAADDAGAQGASENEYQYYEIYGAYSNVASLGSFVVEDGANVSITRYLDKKIMSSECLDRNERNDKINEKN